MRLPSGGSIVIDRTEALVAVDINSSRSTKGQDIEDTAFNTNLEAADEIARQLRIRDLGGLIVIDFIDMGPTRNQRDVENRLRDALKLDRARVQVGRISRFGLLEMSRQRISASLGEASQVTCPRCSGHGSIRGVESLGLSILRLIEEEAMKEKTGQIRAQLPVELAAFLLNEKRSIINKIEARQGIQIVLIPNPHIETPKYELERIREDHLESKDISSYELIKDNQPTPSINDTRSGRKTPIQHDEPVVKDFTASPPPPAKPSNSDASRNETGFVKRLFSTLFGSPSADEKIKEPTTTTKGQQQKSSNERSSSQSESNAERGNRQNSNRRRRGGKGGGSSSSANENRANPNSKVNSDGGSQEKRSQSKGKGKQQQQRGGNEVTAAEKQAKVQDSQKGNDDNHPQSDNSDGNEKNQNRGSGSGLRRGRRGGRRGNNRDRNQTQPQGDNLQNSEQGELNTEITATDNQPSPQSKAVKSGPITTERADPRPDAVAPVSSSTKIKGNDSPQTISEDTPKNKDATDITAQSSSNPLTTPAEAVKTPPKEAAPTPKESGSTETAPAKATDSTPVKPVPSSAEVQVNKSIETEQPVKTQNRPAPSVQKESSPSKVEEAKSVEIEKPKPEAPAKVEKENVQPKKPTSLTDSATATEEEKSPTVKKAAPKKRSVAKKKRAPKKKSVASPNTPKASPLPVNDEPKNNSDTAESKTKQDKPTATQENSE